MTWSEPTLMDYASEARQSDPETSKAAAKLKRGTHRRQVLLCYLTSNGLTDDDAWRLSFVQGAWKRCSELRKLGLIEPTGETRKTSAGVQARVCRITEAGVEALR